MRVVADALTLSVAGRTLVEGLSFVWPGPGLIAVIGPSGAGKSTLLSAIMGWTRPVSGSLYVEPADASVWLVPQNAPLLDARTARENLDVALLARPRAEGGTDHASAVEDVGQAFDVFGLRAVAGTRARHLSGGERQRVALARAALRSPGVLLADEVTAGLDPHSVQTVGAALRELARAGTLVVVATHDERVWSSADDVLDLTAVT